MAIDKNAYESFSVNFFRLLSAREYAVAPEAEDASPGGAPVWSVQKREGASLCIVNVVDAEAADIGRLANRVAEYKEILGKLLDRFKSVTAVYFFCGEKIPAQFEEIADDYDGQPVYFIYWNADFARGEIESLPGQPRELFGLRAAAVDALRLVRGKSDETLLPENGETPGRAPTFREIAERERAGSPFGKNTGQPLCVYFIAAINLIIVALMYLDGFADDPLTAARFGAIVPWRVIYGGEYWRLFSAMFVHFGVTHLLMNTVGLFIFGTRVERHFGHLSFLILYVISGLGGSAASLLFTQGYAAGASGAVYGLVGAILA
ncbi:MAG: rhomboid family intramembrane serine protease, partial [Defluviitaleaceae bacterium]|nr:rhomboid family intramembrane serine protease [Defluviitaleaceae bacterium]